MHFPISFKLLLVVLFLGVPLLWYSIWEMEYSYKKSRHELIIAWVILFISALIYFLYGINYEG